VRNADRFSDPARVMDILASATASLAADSGPVIVKLQGDSDDIMALPLQQSGNDRRVDATGHGDNDATSLCERYGLTHHRQVCRLNGRHLSDAGSSCDPITRRRSKTTLRHCGAPTTGSSNLWRYWRAEASRVTTDEASGHVH
jgi:hypothetical protein